MAADLQPKTPSPEFITALTWLTHNLWVAVSGLIVLLGKIVFGNVSKEIAEIREQNKDQNKKQDQLLEAVNHLARELSELKGELKARRPK